MRKGYLFDSPTDYGGGAFEFNPDICVRADKSQFVIAWSLLETNKYLRYSVTNVPLSILKNATTFESSLGYRVK